MAQLRRAEARWIDSRQRWQLNAQRDGKRRTFTSSTPGRRGKHEAEAKADEWLEAGQPDDIRFDAAWNMYLDHLKNTTGTANYSDNECIGRIWLVDELGSKRLSRIRLADVQAIITDAGKQGKAKRTCKNIKDKLAGFFRFATDQKWEYSVDVSRVKLPTQAPVNARKVIQPDKLKVLFTVGTIRKYNQDYPCWYINAFRLLVVIGCRSGELCGLRKEDYDGKVLHIRRAVNKYREQTGGKTENAKRDILLPQRAINILEAQKEKLKETGVSSKWLFPRLDGSASASQDIWNHWRTYGDQNGIECSIHELRHTFISLMNKDMPAALLKEIVGHSESMDTDGIYGHEVEGDRIRAAKIIDEVFDKHLAE